MDISEIALSEACSCCAETIRRYLVRSEFSHIKSSINEGVKIYTNVSAKDIKTLKQFINRRKRSYQKLPEEYSVRMCPAFHQVFSFETYETCDKFGHRCEDNQNCVIKKIIKICSGDSSENKSAAIINLLEVREKEICLK